MTDFVTIILHHKFIKSKLTPLNMNPISLWQTSFSTNQLRLKRRQFLLFIFLISQHQNLKVIVDPSLNLKCCIRLFTYPSQHCLFFWGAVDFIHICFLISISVLTILIERSTLLDAEVTPAVSQVPVTMYNHSKSLTPSHSQILVARLIFPECCSW